MGGHTLIPLFAIVCGTFVSVTILQLISRYMTQRRVGSQGPSSDEVTRRLERIEQMVSKIVRELESQGESEVTSETIGELVMEHLRELDDIAYVRFASVYRNFREAKDFRAALDELSAEDKPVATLRK